MRFRITIRGDEVELRGRLDGDLADIQQMARDAAPWVVVASPAADDYDPFDPAISLQHLAAENARLREQLASPPPGWYTLGTHGHAETPMEFWGDDGGVPMWERPKVEQADIIEQIRAELTRPFGESAERKAGMMAWLAATLERISKIVGVPTGDVRGS